MDAERIRRSRALVRRYLPENGSLQCSTRIKEIYVMLSFGCNIRCRICPFWGDQGVCHDTDLHSQYQGSFDRQSMHRFLTSARGYHPSTLNLSGGEPLLSPHWKTVAQIARELEYPQIILTTNASFLHRHIEDVADHVDVLQVSFTDPVEWLRGFSPNDPDRDWAAALHELFSQARRRNPALQIVVNYALERDSIASVERFVDAALSSPGLVDELRLIHPMYLSPPLLRAHQADLAKFGTAARFWEGFGAQQHGTDIAALRHALSAIRTRHPSVMVFPFLEDEELADWYGDGGFLPERYSDLCGAPWTQVHVVPNGDVWACYDVVLGNIHRDDVETIWNGPQAQMLRNHVATEGLFRGCSGCFLKYSVMESGTQETP